MTMARTGRIWEFMNRNLVTIVVVPGLVLLHWGWFKLQDVEAFVPKEEKKDFPVFISARYLYNKWSKRDDDEKTQPQE